MKNKFNKYVGKRIQTHENAHSFYSPTLRRHLTQRRYGVSADCPIIREIFKKAAKDNLYVRFWGVSTPASGPKDKSTKRLNIFFEKDGARHFKIKSIKRG